MEQKKQECLTLSVAEVAKMLGKSPVFVRYMVENNVIPGKVIKRKGHRNAYIIFKKDFLQMINAI